MSKIKEFFNETKGELKHVNWPTRSQTTVFTIIVVLISIIIAYFLGLFDFIFSLGLGKLIGFN